MEVIAIAMQKGGTGKTTTAAVLAQAAAYRKKRVLAIDLDPQGDLSFILGADPNLQGSYELLQGAAAEDTIQATDQGIDLISADSNLAALVTGTGSASKLKQALEPVKGNYDLAVVDVPPTVGELLYNALYAATGLVIPLQADTLNLKNLQLTIATAKKMQQQNTGLSIKGILFTANSERSIIARQMQEGIIEAAAELGAAYLGDIRKCVSVKEAQAMQASLYQYAPKCTAAADYLNILDQIC